MNLATPLIRILPSLALLLLLATPQLLHAAPMRPYAGIGVLLLPLSPTLAQEALADLPLCDQPAMQRIATLGRATAPSLEWLLDLRPESAAVVVMARRGEWLRVSYDDAGREGWVRPLWRNAFETWEELLDGRSVRLLPGIRKQYSRLFGRPGGESLAEVDGSRRFRVLEMSGDWVRVEGGDMPGGWLRWRDEDGRLLLGVVAAEGAAGER